MSVMQHNWYDSNSVRQYPMDMSATSIDDFENPIPTALLQDVNVYVPEHLGVVEVYIGSCHMTGAVASVVLVGLSAGGPVPLCSAVTTPGASRLTAVEPLTDGVRGWVVLGIPNANGVGRWTASNPSQTRLAAGCWSAYRRPPVLSLGASGRRIRLTGDVEIRASWHLQLVSDTRQVSGRAARVMVLRLDPELPNETKSSYVAVCVDTGGACSPAPIQTINKVRPDADGNITVEIRGIDLSSLVDSSGRVNGVVLRSQLGMIDICDSNKGLEINEIDVPECI